MAERRQSFGARVRREVGHDGVDSSASPAAEMLCCISINQKLIGAPRFQICARAMSGSAIRLRSFR
jgi:hypothetical protein